MACYSTKINAYFYAHCIWIHYIIPTFFRKRMLGFFLIIYCIKRENWMDLSKVSIFQSLQRQWPQQTNSLSFMMKKKKNYFDSVWKNKNISGNPEVKPSAASQVSISLYLGKAATPACLKAGQTPKV